MEANKVTLKTVAISAGTILVLETVFRLNILPNTASSLLELGLIRALQSIVLILIVVRLENNAGAIGLSRSGLASGIKKGIIWSACFGTAAGILFVLLLFAGVHATKFVSAPVPSSWRQVAIFYLVGGVIAPIAEEIFFRGILYGYFRRWGVFTAIILSTLIFAFIHPLGHRIPVTQLIGGIVFATAYEKEKNLIVPITIHSLGNLVIFSLPFVA